MGKAEVTLIFFILSFTNVMMQEVKSPCETKGLEVMELAEELKSIYERLEGETTAVRIACAAKLIREVINLTNSLPPIQFFKLAAWCEYTLKTGSTLNQRSMDNVRSGINKLYEQGQDALKLYLQDEKGEEEVSSVIEELLQQQILPFHKISKLIKNLDCKEGFTLPLMATIIRLIRSNGMETSPEAIVFIHLLHYFQQNKVCRSQMDETELEELRENLPTSLRNIVFEKQVKVRSTEYMYYLTAENSTGMVDRYRRKVAGMLQGQVEDGQQRWTFEPVDMDEPSKVYIKNINLNEYLMVSVLDYDQDRRKVFTWISGRKIANGVFLIEPDGEDVFIRSMEMLGYLEIEPSKGLVYMWKSGKKPHTARWQIEALPVGSSLKNETFYSWIGGRLVGV